MPSLSVLVPEATTNLIKNPSFEANTTGWTATSATVSRVHTRARFGHASAQIVTSNTLANEGMYYRVSDYFSGETTVSIYARGSGIVQIRLRDGYFGYDWTSKPVALTDDMWQRLEVTGAATTGGDMRLYIETASKQSITFYVDGAQMERKGYATTYCDGDQPGCKWDIVKNARPSFRPSSTRVGGRWVALAGPCRNNNADSDIYVTTMGGFGMPPVTQNVQVYSQIPGAFYQNTKVQPRPVTLLFHTKHEDFGRRGKASLQAIHELRQQLVDIFKPDRSAGQEPLLFKYDDGKTPVYLWMRYEAGLDGDWDIRNKWYNQFPIRLLATDPFFYEDNQNVQVLETSKTLTVNHAIAKEDGEWNFMNGGLTDATNNVLCSVVGPDGKVYFGGDFYYANHDKDAIDSDIVVGGRAYWDGAKWVAIRAVGGTSPILHGICVAPNGWIYVTGSFSSIGNNAPAATRVAYYRPDTDTWYAMGAGLDGLGRAIVAAPNGDIYIGGDFTSPHNRITRWDGSQFQPVGATGLDNSVYALAMSPDGETLYVGGNFTDEDTPTAADLTRVCSYTPSTDTFSQMGDGANDIVRSIVVGPDLSPYIGGEFTASGSDTIYRVAKWNGTNWERLGGGLRGGDVYDLAFTADGLLVAVGWFTYCGGATVRADQLAYWNGATWFPGDAIFQPGTYAVMTTIAINEDGNLYFGSSTDSLFPQVSATNTVINTGSREVSPIIWLTGDGHLRWIENISTGKKIPFDLDIYANEEITIDFGAGTMTSNTRGNVLYGLLPGGAFKDFTLIPGTNRINVFIYDDVVATAQISYVPSHWSADAVARDEEM